MKISTKGRYALRIMVDLAQQHSNEFIPLRDVSERQDISEKYAEMIVGLLSKTGFLFSSRGKGGGYKLARPPETITVASILKAVEGSLAPVACLDIPDNVCPRADQCVTLPMWRELERRIDEYLESVTIADLAGESAAVGADYCI
ncbi:MAG: RrF2 family transcriptional regulator [Oscillospiraceae bacterium]|jgi:Rrf2 family iron-sulfur cluster assembly transcriptional regulator